MITGLIKPDKADRQKISEFIHTRERMRDPPGIKDFLYTDIRIKCLYV